MKRATAATRGRMSGRRWLPAVVFRGVLGVGTLLLAALTARADGGTVRATRVVGSHRVTVLTEPTPPRVGLLDVQVLVQDEHSRALAPMARVAIRGAPTGTDAWRSATPHAPHNRIYRAAVLRPDRPGRWTVDVRVDFGRDQARLSFDLEVAPAPAPWLDLWAWLAWPLVPLAGMARYLVRQVRGRRPRFGPSSR